MGALSADQIIWLEIELERYISQQQARFIERCVTLSARQKTPLLEYFSANHLDSVRILDISPERLENPPFYPGLQALGFNNLPDMSGMAATTFGDVVVSHTRFTERLLFHELVHVVQYSRLGTKEFAKLYVGGFLSGGSYEAIPLELCAYELEDRFVTGKPPFSVEMEVDKWIGGNRF